MPFGRSATSSQQYPFAIISTASTPAFSIDNRNQWIAHNHHLAPPSINSTNIMPTRTPTHPRFERTLSRLPLHLHGSASGHHHRSIQYVCVTLCKARSDIRLVKPSSSDSNACMRTPPLRLLHFLLFCATFDTCFNDSTPLCHFNVIVLVLVSLQSSWHRRLRFFRARGVCGHIVAAYHSCVILALIQFDNLANARIRCSRHLHHHISSIFITACHLRATHGVMSR